MRALLYVIGFGYALLVTGYFILRPRALARPGLKVAAIWKPLVIFSLFLIGINAIILYIGLFMMD